MADKKLTPEIISILEEACEDSIGNFEIEVHENDSGGQGYMGEMMFISLKNTCTNKTFHLVIKQAVPTEHASYKTFMSMVYFNEIHFYKNIWKALVRFQRSFLKDLQFNKIPKFYGSCDVPGKEKLVMGNLKYSDFRMFPRDGTFDDVHTTLLMRAYGQFHGTSAAFREIHPEEYRKLTRDLKSPIDSLTGMDEISGFILLSMKRLYGLLEDDKIKEKLKIYCEKAAQIATDLLKYNGKNPTINHGDCWSNNLMFKYDEDGAPLDMVLLDFQLCRNSSVVSDLSYLIYSGTSKEIFGKLDHYLKIYHDTFSDTLRNFNLDPSKIFTFDDLRTEWKDRCAYGFIMGQLLLGNKFSKQYEKQNFVDLMEKDGFKNMTTEMHSTLLEQYQTDVTKLNEICLDMVQHLYDNDYL